MMTPKDQWIAFFEHRYTNDAVPAFQGLGFVVEVHGFHETAKYVKDSNEARGRDWFGVQWIRDDSIGEMVPDPTATFVLDEIGNWREKVIWPDLDAHNWEAAASLDLQKIDRDNQLIYLVVEEGPFERLHTLMGFENALVALIEDVGECEAFFAEWIKWKLRLLEKIKQYYNPDVIMYHDDAGTQTNLFYSPDIWRRVFKPLLRQACDKAHRMGMFFEYHSCGKIEQIIPELVDIGVDAWQGQEINDILACKAVTGNKLAYHPTPDYQSLVVQQNTISEEEVRRITREGFIKALEGGQYAPLVMPFGDWVTGVMLNETVRLYRELCADPVG
jgi:uroporphyrinogen decarboxylase